MSLLETMRKGTDSAVTRVFIGVLFFSFIAFFATRGDHDKRSAVLAVVNGESITDSDLNVARRDQLRRMKKSGLGRDEQAAFDRQVLDGLIGEEVLYQEAQKLGIAAADDEVARIIAGAGAFQGTDGKFDEKTYQKALRQMDTTPAKFETRLRRQLMIEKLQWFALHAVSVGEGETKAAWTEQATKLTMTYIRLPDTAFLDAVTVTDAERDDFVAKNTDKLQARYKSAFERQFKLPKRYHLRTILLRTDKDELANDTAAKEAIRAHAEALRTQAEAGADFAELARANSEDLTAADGGDLGTLAADQLDSVLASAADEAGPGHLSKVVQTGRGYQLLKVESIEDAREIPFDEAKNDLAVAMIRDEKVGPVARDYAMKLIGAWKTADAPPRELTEPLKLPVDTSAPFSLADPAIPAVGQSAPLYAALRTAAPGQVLPVPFDVDGTLFVVALVSRTEPDPAGYAEEKPSVQAQLIYQRRQQFIAEWVESVKAGATVEDHTAGVTAEASGS